MINKNSQVVASFQEAGSALVRKGNYEEAKIQVTNGHTDDEVCVILQQMKTLKEAEFGYATKTVNLGYEFIENALNLDNKGTSQKPKCPRGKNIHHWKKSPEGRLADRWKVSSNEDKVRVQLEMIANDQNLTLLNFEIL